MDYLASLRVGEFYDRDQLSAKWGYSGRQAISRGVVTPKQSGLIFLFVTKEKDLTATQYDDYISDCYLYWDGEEKKGNDLRIASSYRTGEQIYLFYRHRHHRNFEYKGRILLERFIEKKIGPNKFVFKIIGDFDREFNSPNVYKNFDPKFTEKLSLSLSRVGQGDFRLNVMDLWEGCSISAVTVPELLTASHIKPWRSSSDAERLDPFNGLLLTPIYDRLFDKGFISFENDGNVILSKKILPHARTIYLTEDIRLRHVFSENCKYLASHRDKVFIR